MNTARVSPVPSITRFPVPVSLMMLFDPSWKICKSSLAPKVARALSAKFNLSNDASKVIVDMPADPRKLTSPWNVDTPRTLNAALSLLDVPTVATPTIVMSVAPIPPRLPPT